MWYLLIIPVLVTGIGYLLHPHKITFAELGLPVGAGILTLIISYYVMKEVTLRDVEYRGDLVESVVYYEPYSTWVSRTCSRTVSCGKNCRRTVFYDCSYCDYTSARYEIRTKTGRSSSVSEQKYNELKEKWGGDPSFIELDRSIVYHGGCGQDGDAYQVSWPGEVLTSEAYCWEVPFTNPVKASHSAFRYEDITKENADSLGLYHYPEFFDFYRQPAILSKDFRFRETVYRKFEYLNANLGPRNKVKVFTLLFKNKDINVASLQEQYWEGGNQNEIVVCIGVDDKLNITWVKPFTWCDNRRVKIDLREDLAEIGVFDPDAILKVYERIISSEFKYKSFSDFNYLSFDPTATQYIWVSIITLIVSVLSTIFIIKNEIDPV